MKMQVPPVVLQSVPLCIASFIAAVFYRACTGKIRNGGGNVLVQCIESVFMQRNPLFQMLMLVFTIVIPVSYLAFKDHSIPGSEQMAVLVAFLVSNTAFLTTGLTDPGTVTADNVDQESRRYPYDDFWYPESKRKCPHSDMNRPARARWCNVSRRMVSKFDHYCIWTNNSIGRNNYAWFLLFLVTSAVSMSTISLVIYRDVHRRFVGDKQAHEAEPAFAKHVSTWIRAFPYAQRNDPVSVWVISLAMSGAVATGSMFLYHMGLLSHGVTTMESMYYMNNVSPFTQEEFDDAEASSPVWPHTDGFVQNLANAIAGN